MELRRYFGIDLLLSEHTAREIWDEGNRQLAQMPVQNMLARYRVAVVGTTDDPADNLRHHHALDKEFRAGKTNLRMAPTFRPDVAHNAIRLIRRRGTPGSRAELGRCHQPARGFT